MITHRGRTLTARQIAAITPIISSIVRGTDLSLTDFESACHEALSQLDSDCREDTEADHEQL
jgi:hypothetical protein